MSSSRKEAHVQLALHGPVGFRSKTSGFETIDLPYSALPELNYADVHTSTSWLNYTLGLPLIVTGMTGGYPDAERINGQLAEACAEVGVALGVGSMRSVLDDPRHASTFSVVKGAAGTIPILANLGAVQVARSHRQQTLQRTLDLVVSLVDAAAVAIHLNPLQELMQPEGEPEYAGVLDAIAAAVQHSPVPVVVKEVGAGISGRVARQLASVGVRMIDVAGAGGTSWAGIEILRRDDPDAAEAFWDVGWSTVDCLRQVVGTVPTVIASGGLSSGTDLAKALALGAKIGGVARPLLQALEHGGISGVVSLLHNWRTDLRRWLFLTGSPSLNDFVSILHRAD